MDEVNSTESSQEMSNAESPLWQYVTKVEKPAGASVKSGGNTYFKCNYCDIVFMGSYSRVKAHLLQISGKGIRACRNVSKSHRLEMQRMHDQVEANKLEQEQRSHIPLPPPPPGRGIPISPFRRQEGSDSSHSTNLVDAKRRKVTMNTTLEKAFQNNARHDLDSRIARMFYTGGLPFNFARNPHYRSSYAFAATHSIPGYLPPGYNALRTTLLQKERAHVERLLKPIKDSWLENGVSIVSDGWSDPQRRPLINVMAVSDGGPVFIKAIDGSGEFKDKHYIAGVLKDAIKEIGHEKVVQVITDNANVMKAAGALIEGEYPKIFWTPCVVHTLNLALKNICAAKNTEKNEVTYEECSWITRVADDASFIRVFIMNHSMRLAMFNEFCPLKLLQVADTRFASVVVTLKRLKLIKRCLQAMAISDQWASYREDDVGKAQKVKDMILSDLWWDNIDYILEFTAPIYDMLRIADTDKPCLHLVYEMWDSMIEKVKAVIYRHEGLEDDQYSSFWVVVYDILIDRWTKNSTPLHCLAHSLNPKYYSIEWISENPKRIPPHRDHEISMERSKCLERYFEDENDLTVVKYEFAKFSGGRFPSPSALTDRWTLLPLVWWQYHGSAFPTIQTLALKLLGQPCSSSCAERNWSTYKFIHSLKRNKMAHACAEDLVYVHSNLRLLSRRNEEYIHTATKMWDIAGDSWNESDMHGGAGILENAALTLDELELEAIVIGNVNTSATTSESEVRSETIDLEDDDICV
ncbi:uncharacterized protein LOC115959595 [Quercus lobata]|uniref:BED-type domain-containing protein n=1 Tax=Quercus lobata TaxID=97700 RepID=A0A7N2KT08_QUELO|nr:uncharacterized protein LOC115959595 [Quercus lobata]